MQHNSDIREKTNRYILNGLKQIKYFFGHRIYAYTDKESGFIEGFFIDSKGRRYVILKVKHPIQFDHAKASYLVNTPSSRIKHYRICYSPFQLFVGGLFGKNLSNVNRKLRKWKI